MFVRSFCECLNLANLAIIVILLNWYLLLFEFHVVIGILNAALWESA